MVFLFVLTLPGQNSQAFAQGCPCSIWNNATVPASPDAGPDSPVELGVKFRSDVAGYVTGIRFYKSAANTGPHVGNLWSVAGVKLATVTFSNETASGWQTAMFSAPVAIDANTIYVASYHLTTGHYAFTSNFFASSGVDNGPLHALASSISPNGVFRYASTGGFPNSTYQAANYWVDVVFETAIVDTTPPTVTATDPSALAVVAPPAQVAATFSEALNPSTVSNATFELRNGSNTLVSGTASYNAATHRAVFTPAAPLAYLETFTATIRGGSGGVTDPAGNALASDYSWTFMTGAAPPPPPDQGPGGPILVVSAPGNPFSRYYAEILRAEGLNAFAVMDLAAVNASVLADYDVVVLGNIPLSTTEVTMFTNWVNAGGRLIAMRPDKKLAVLLGLTDASATLSDSYLLIDTSSGPGIGLVRETIQFHGQADLYTTAGATALATLYSSASVSASSPAVTLRQVGSNGGQAAAFAFDLARSVVYTRQGNPAWAGTDRDGSLPIRPDDMFFGGKQPDWVDLTKVAIPQADEQQRLFAKLIEQMNAARRPLPRFWYLPRGLKAAIVMTGDDHGNGGTLPRFDQFVASSVPGCSVDDWECIRGTSYIYTNTPISADVAAAYAAQGFEIGLHITTNCSDYTSSSIGNTYTSQLASWRTKYSVLASPRTNRTHCIVWSDWSSQATAALQNGIRLDTNYYYWPGTWLNNRPGMFTGSGMPMRFAASSGDLIDVYQATTQMTDESGQTFPMTIDTLLDRALGQDGYYGVFTANMHTDVGASAGATAIVASAQSRDVPVVTATQMLTWLDGRNGSTYRNLAWNGVVLTFDIEVGAGARGLQAMVPAQVNGYPVLSVAAGHVAVVYREEIIKGTSYITFPATNATYRVTYDPLPDTSITSAPPAITTSPSATFQFASTASGSTFQCSLDGAAFAACSTGVTYPSLADGSHTFRVRAVSGAGTDPTPASRTWTVDATAPVISAVTATPLTTSATITWTTNELSDSVVNYGTSAGSLTSSATVATLVTSHSVTLTGLTSGVTYFYCVTSRDARGLSATAPATPASFVTLTNVTRAPASVTITSGSLRSGGVSNLGSNNGSYYQVNSTTSGTRTSTWYGSFTGVSSSLANLRVTYSGLQSRAVSQNIEIFRWSDNTWVGLDSRTVSTTEIVISNLAAAGAAGNYVSSGGQVRVRVRSVGTSISFFTVADFMQIRFDQP